MKKDVIDRIEARHIQQALQAYEEGKAHAFGRSVRYDLVHDGKRYPPKAILGIAAEIATGTPLTPKDFGGGENTLCFKVLRKHGFVVEPKERPLHS